MTSKDLYITSATINYLTTFYENVISALYTWCQSKIWCQSNSSEVLPRSITEEHFYQMADITFKLSPRLEKFSILV